MPVPSSGAISLNDFHIEAGGTSGTTCSLNDADIRALIGKSSGAQMSFNEWYGASGGNDVGDFTSVVHNEGGKYPATYYGYNDGVLGVVAFGTAHDATIRASNGTDITVKAIATATSGFGNFAYLYIVGNYGGSNLNTIFGGSNVTWNGTVMSSYTSTNPLGVYNTGGNFTSFVMTPTNNISAGRYNNVHVG